MARAAAHAARPQAPKTRLALWPLTVALWPMNWCHPVAFELRGPTRPQTLVLLVARAETRPQTPVRWAEVREGSAMPAAWS